MIYCSKRQQIHSGHPVRKDKDMKYLIKDTTREEREKIVRGGLLCDANECENCSACGLYGAGDMLELYQPYIDGEMELAEINAEFRSGTVH